MPITLTTAEYVRHWARETPDHFALITDDERISYNELDERSNRVAQGLAACGISQGDRVAYLDKNSCEHVELFFGIAKLNGIPCPVNFRLSSREITAIVKDSGSKAFLVGAEFLTHADEVAAELNDVQVFTAGSGASRYPSYESLRDGSSDLDPRVPQGPDDVAYLLYSSGTTGLPKGVLLTQANLSAALSEYPASFGLERHSVSMAAMPLFHIGGASWALAAHAVGATNVIVREPKPTILIDTIERERVTHTFLVPAALQFMLESHAVAGHEYTSLRCIVYGASPISEHVLRSSMKTFPNCEFAQGYGLTEGTGLTAVLPRADHDPDSHYKYRMRSVGRPIPGIQVRIVDPLTGVDAPKESVGEIWIKGPTVMKGYWQRSQETADTIVDGEWLRSGDAGYTDADGYIYLRDRIKDMIITGGENVYPAEVENALMSHPDVADVAVIGVPSAKWGETPKAFVVRTMNSSVSAQELMGYCGERLARFKCPTSIDWIDELPRNPSGKILKKELRASHS